MRMCVSSTDQEGVVSAGTTLRFIQKGSAVCARYDGGTIVRGCLVGEIAGSALRFRFVQRETTGGIHSGRSECEVTSLPDGRTRIIEHFTWTSRAGAGTNVFEEILEWH